MNPTSKPLAPFSCTYTPNVPELLTQLNCSLAVNMADIDGDGDQDLIKGEVFEYSSIFSYQENIGTQSDPDFGTPVNNPFGFDVIGDVILPSSADIDADGDMDVFLGSYSYIAPIGSYEILFYENITPVSTNDLINKSTLKFGPNPTPDLISLQVEINSKNTEINLSLIENKGQILIHQTVPAIGNQINWETYIKHFPAGSYFIRLEAEGHFGIIPFTKI